MGMLLLAVLTLMGQYMQSTCLLSGQAFATSEATGHRNVSRPRRWRESHVAIQ